MKMAGGAADCTARCRSSAHATELVTALLGRSPDLPVLAWLVRHCHTPGGSKVVIAQRSVARIYLTD